MPKGGDAGDGDERGGRVTEEEEEKPEEKEEDVEEGEDSEDEEDSEEEEEVGIALQLPQRATRGHAYQRLIGEALEEDQAFWGHNTWADEEEDDDYNCSEGEEVYEDVIDSDFDRPEDDEESDSGNDGGLGEGEGRRRGQGETSKAKQRRDKKRNRERRDAREEDEDDGKKSRKQAFDLMWKRRQAKREREERQRREKKKQAKRERQEEEERRKVGVKEEVEERENDNEDRQDERRSKQKQEVKQEGPTGEARQLRMTRGRLLRGGDGGNSTSDEQEQGNSKSSSSSQKRKKRQQKPSESTRERATAREVTLEEHLEEARRTEERNLAALLAMEERDEARRLRHVFDLKKNMYAGDYDRYFSWASWLVVGDQAAEDENEAAPAAATAEQWQQSQQQQSQQHQLGTKQEKMPLRDGDAEETTKMLLSGSVGVHTEEEERHKDKIEAARSAAALRAGETSAAGTSLCSVKVERPVLLAAEGGEGAVDAAREGAIAERTGAAEVKGNDSSATPAEGVRGSNVPRAAVAERKLIQEKEKKKDEGVDQCSTALSRPPGTACDTASVNQYLPGAHTSEKGFLQSQQQGTVGEESMEQPQQVETASMFSSRNTSTIKEVPDDRKDILPTAANQEETDEALEEAKENEGYAMELRMFTDGKFPDIYMQQPLSAPTPPRCMITGQRAKYRDPLTGAPYATAHAFKCLRESFQKIREQQLLQTMQQIKDATGPTQIADRGKTSITTLTEGGLSFALPVVTSAVTAAAAADNDHVYLASDLLLCNGTSSGSPGNTGSYGSNVEERVVEALSVQQARQRKVVAAGHTAIMKKTSVTGKSLTAVGCPQRSRSPVEDAACHTAPVEAWRMCKGAEQKRRRNARCAASCERKAGRSRATRQPS